MEESSTVAQVSTVVFSVWLLFFAGFMTYKMILDHIRWKRFSEAFKLRTKLFTALVNEKITKEEYDNFVSLLDDETPAAIALAKDKLQSLPAGKRKK